MQQYLPKIRKWALYGFAALGALAVLFMVGQIFMGGTAKVSTSGYGSGFGVSQGISAPSPGKSVFDLSETLFGDRTSSGSVQTQTNESVSEGALTERKVIKNGSLSLLVKDAEEVAESLKALATRLGGFVGESQIYEVSAGVKTGTVTIRVPADKFDEAVGEAKKLAVKVERENINAQDVTEEFIDLEARLKNLEAEEAQYLDIMKRAKTVDDTLAVAQRLSDVRGRIEQIKGQLQYLSRQVDMASLTVSLTAEADIEVFGIRWRPLFVVKQSFRTMLTGLTGYVDSMIRFVFSLPIIFVWLLTVGACGFVVWKVVLWLQKKFFAKTQ